LPIVAKDFESLFSGLGAILFHMNSANLPLIFSVEKDSALDTLEAVLAIARRGGLRLDTLNLHPAEQDDIVSVELQAPDPDLLDLFVARLHNVIGVHNIIRLECRPTLHVAWGT
jgi:acetolactate synthase regulatory subunit